MSWNGFISVSLLIIILKIRKNRAGKRDQRKQNTSILRRRYLMHFTTKQIVGKNTLTSPEWTLSGNHRPDWHVLSIHPDHFHGVSLFLRLTWTAFFWCMQRVYHILKTNFGKHMCSLFLVLFVNHVVCNLVWNLLDWLEVWCQCCKLKKRQTFGLQDLHQIIGSQCL